MCVQETILIFLCDDVAISIAHSLLPRQTTIHPLLPLLICKINSDY